MIETEAKRVDSDLFAVYDIGDGTLVIDHPHPETGELFPTAVGSLPIPKQLTGLAFGIRNAETSRDQQLAILKDQLATIKLHIEAVNERADKTVGQLSGMGAGLLDQLHEQGLTAVDAKKRPRLPIAGCGAWVTNTKAAGYETDGWNNMDRDARADIALAHKDLFKVEMVPAQKVITPNRSEIIKAMKKGAAIDGFSLIEAVDGVKFKIEKGTGLPPVGMTADKVGE